MEHRFGFQVAVRTQDSTVDAHANALVFPNGSLTLIENDEVQVDVEGGAAAESMYFNPKDYGAFGDDTSHPITLDDILANDAEWWGTYSVGTEWDTVAWQEMIYDIFGGPLSEVGSNPYHTNPSGLAKLNVGIFVPNGTYLVNNVDLHHLNGFYMKGATKFSSTLRTSVSNAKIFDGDAIAYGVFSNLQFRAGANATSTALVHLDYKNAVGGGDGIDDLRPQNITFHDCIFHGNSQLGHIGVWIAKSGGGAQGDNVRFYNCYANGFKEAGVQLGGGPTTNYGYNAIHVQWFGGDIQDCHKYGLAAYGGSFLVDGPTCENGNVTTAGGVEQTGYDFYSEAPASSCIVRNVRSESLRFAAGTWSVYDSSILGPAVTRTAQWKDLPNTVSFKNQLVTGTPYGGDGKMYIVTTEITATYYDVLSPFSTTVLTVGETYTPGELVGMWVQLRYPNCFDAQYRQVSSNTASTITVSPAFDFLPGDAPGSACGDHTQYRVFATFPVFGGLGDNTATGGSLTTIVKSGAGWTTNAFVGYKVTIISGAGRYQYGIITSNTSDTLTVSAGWVSDYEEVANHTVVDTYGHVVITAPASGSHFVVEPNWNGGTVTAGNVSMDALVPHAVGAPSTGGGFQGTLNGFSVEYGGDGVFGEVVTLDNVKFTQADWIHSSSGNKLDTNFPRFKTRNVIVRRVDADSDSMLVKWSVARNSYAGTFKDWSQEQKSREWLVWSGGDTGGGEAHYDVGIGRGGGRRIADSNSRSLNILAILGTLGRRLPSSLQTDAAGDDLDIQGGLSTGTGLAGKIRFLLGKAGASSSSNVNPGTVVAEIGANGFTLRSFGVYPSLPNAKLVGGNVGNLASGDNTIYTVPAGRKALVLSTQIFNPTGGAINNIQYVNVGGTQMRIRNGVALAANSTVQYAVGVVLNAGDYYIINTGGAGLNCFTKIVEYDDMMTAYKTIFAANPAATATLYTVPAGKSAIILNNQHNAIFTNGNVNMTNDSGGTRVYNWYQVSSGGSPGTSNQITAAISVANANENLALASGILNAGDYIAINIDTATTGHVVWFTILET